MVKFEEIGRYYDNGEKRKAMNKLGAMETRIKWKLAHEADEMAKIRFFNDLKTIQRIKEIF